MVLHLTKLFTLLLDQEFVRYSQMASKHIKLRDLKHRVTVCSMQDVVLDGGVMRLSRKGIYTAWAMIEPKRASNFSAPGFAIQEDRNSRSHVITIRYRSDLDFSSAAWLYEERLKSPPRWFKVIRGVDKEESGQWFVMDCRLVERSDDAVGPTKDVETSALVATVMPKGVKL